MLEKTWFVDFLRFLWPSTTLTGERFRKAVVRYQVVTNVWKLRYETRINYFFFFWIVFLTRNINAHRGHFIYLRTYRLRVTSMDRINRVKAVFPIFYRHIVRCFLFRLFEHLWRGLIGSLDHLACVIGFPLYLAVWHGCTCINKFLREGRAEKVLSCIQHVSVAIKSRLCLMSACCRRSYTWMMEEIILALPFRS